MLKVITVSIALMAVLGPRTSNSLATNFKAAKNAGDDVVNPSKELLFLLKNLSKLRKSVPEKIENKSDTVVEELKEAGMSDEEIEDLTATAVMMSEFLMLIPDLVQKLELVADEDVVYNSKLYLLGLPNSLGPLGYIAFKSVMEDEMGEVITPEKATERSKRSIHGLGAGGLGGLGLGGLALGAGFAKTVAATLPALPAFPLILPFFLPPVVLAPLIPAALALKAIKHHLVKKALIVGGIGAAGAAIGGGGASKKKTPTYAPLPHPEVVSVTRYGQEKKSYGQEKKSYH